MKRNRRETGEWEWVRKAHLPSTPVRWSASIVMAVGLMAVSAMSGNIQGKSQKATATVANSPHDMVLISGGAFVMGNDGSYADEQPWHNVKVSPFYLDAHEVTNAQFTEFVKATGYVTQAERDGHCWAYFKGETNWQYDAGTDWRHPQGLTSSIDEKMNHPVVCVSWDDATAYAKWAGKRLPTEAEWEYAARAGFGGHFIAATGNSDSDQSHHVGHAPAGGTADQSPSSKSHASEMHRAASKTKNSETEIVANVWEGHWPERNEMTDGFYYTAPVESFAPNAWGIYDMLGNVWEWTADWYDSTYYSHSPKANPSGPQTGEKRVARGGSWFCSPNYCGAYSTHYRGASPHDHAFNNVGFRCAKDVPAQESR